MALTQTEINKRMIELRNLRKLHSAARARVQALEAENKTLKQRITELEAENKVLQDKLTDITYQLSELQTILFGKQHNARQTLEQDDDDESDHTPPAPRKADSYRRPIPKDSEVTKIIHHRFPRKRNGDIRLRTYYVEDIPLDIQKIVEKHVVEQYYDHTRRLWVSRDPLPTASVILGDNVRILIATLVTIQRLSFAQTQGLVETLFHISVSDGEIAAILKREATRLQPAADAQRARIQAEASHHMDESRYDVAGETHYVWSMTGGESGETAYILGTTRGKGNALTLRGDSTGVLISDDYGVYRHLAEHHQLCFAHLLRTFRDLAGHQGFTDRQCAAIQATYREIKALYYAVCSAVADRDPPVHRAILTERFTAVSAITDTDPKPVVRAKTTLRKNIAKYLTCLSFPSIALTNNAAERALRHLVLKRKVSFGVRSHAGAHVMATLFTVLLSLHRDPASYFERYRELRRV